MALTFRYRYVNFGTIFTSELGLRGSEKALDLPGRLFANELVTDVGGTCLGNNEPLAILDHHFSREGQFPSASAAVLHKAPLLRERFAHSAGDLFWLVTHQEPDFDAFCSLYLARWILEDADAFVDWQDYGLHPQGWLELRERPETQKIDWFNPDLSRVPPEHRWALLLASYASRLDGRRRISCPRQRALTSILAAAMKRGRNYLSDTSGATEFFDEVRAALLQGDLNPVFDSVLERSTRFAPELAMLDHEAAAYERDLGRARKSIVYLPQAEAPSTGFFKSPKEVARLELESKRREVNAEELLLADTFRIPTDGIYLRDPECMLFQEWARLDVGNSALAAGFEFTAIAYSGAYPSDALNQSEYVFSLDPERAKGRHLYTVWSRLQTKRMEALRAAQHAPFDFAHGNLLQSGPAARKAQSPGAPVTAVLGTPSSAQPPAGASQVMVAAPAAQQSTKADRLATDPWFGGPNSNGMLVRTPSQGTAIAPAGTRHDLRDDSVAEEVRTELELAIYAAQSLVTGPQVSVIDLAGAEDCEDHDPRSWDLNAAREIPPPPESYFRFAAARLRADVPIAAGNGEGHSLAAQIGDTLWQVLYPEQPGALPENFVRRHVMVTAEGVAVWGLRGIAIAQKSASLSATPSPAQHRTIAEDFAKVVSLVRDIRQFSAAGGHVLEAGPQLSSERAGANPPRAFANANAALVQGLVQGEDLARRAVEVEQLFTTPEREILRRFADAIGMDQLLAALRELNQSAAENLHRRELASQARSREERGDTIAKLRSKLGWMEVFLLAFLAAPISQVVVGFYGGEASTRRAAAFLSGLLVAGLMAWILKPWKRKPEAGDIGLGTPSVILAILIAACIAAWAVDLLKIWAK